MNKLFRDQVDTLFAKIAYPFDPAEVAEQLRSLGQTETLKDLTRGSHVVNAVSETLPAAAQSLEHGVRSVGNAVLSPAAHIGPPILKGLGSLGRTVQESPKLLRAAIGTAALAPILGSSMMSRQQGFENNVTNSEKDPERAVVASEKGASMFELETFLDKKAGVFNSVKPDRIEGPMGSLFGNSIRSGLIQTAGATVAHGLVNAVGDIFGKGTSALYDYFVLDDKRKKLLAKVTTDDHVLHDALERNPHARQIILDAYETMQKVAPTLSMDQNAVKSFLREAVIGGAGVNYATIKNLAETEGEIRKNQGKRSGNERK